MLTAGIFKKGKEEVCVTYAHFAANPISYN